MNMTMVLLVFLLSLQGSSARILPDRYASAALAAEEFTEVVDQISSVIYIGQSFRRAYIDDNLGLPLCGDGNPLVAVSPNQCPGASKDFDLLPPCSANLSTKQVCRGPGACNAPALDNCGPDRSVFVIHDSEIISGLQRIARQLFAASFWIFIIGLLSNIPRMYLLKPKCIGTTLLPVSGESPRRRMWYYRCQRNGVGRFFCRSFYFVSCILTIIYLPVTNGYRQNIDWNDSWRVGLMTFGVLLAWMSKEVMLMFMIWHELQIWKEDEEAEMGKVLAKLELPFFGAFLAYRMKPEVAVQVADHRSRYKAALRITRDFPEIVIDVVDMITFGVTWFNVLDVVLAVIMISVHCLVMFFYCLQYSCKAMAPHGKTALAAISEATDTSHIKPETMGASAPCSEQTRPKPDETAVI